MTFGNTYIVLTKSNPAFEVGFDVLFTNTYDTFIEIILQSSHLCEMHLHINYIIMLYLLLNNFSSFSYSLTRYMMPYPRGNILYTTAEYQNAAQLNERGYLKKSRFERKHKKQGWPFGCGTV